jgi:hypothetical protein
MPRTRINPRLAKLHYSYTVEEIARLFGVHKHTVRAWLKSGLSSVGPQRPILVLGKDLRMFLEKRRAGSKRPCTPGTMYCLKCKAPRPPALKMVEFLRLADASGNLTALCGICGTTMYRRCRFAAINVVMPGIPVSLVEDPLRISQSSIPSSNSA